MNIGTVDPTLLRSIRTYSDDLGLFSLTSQWGGGRLLWCKKMYPGASSSISGEDRIMLSSLKVPTDTPMLVRRKAGVNSVFWVCWDRESLLRSLDQPHARRESAP